MIMRPTSRLSQSYCPRWIKVLALFVFIAAAAAAGVVFAAKVWACDPGQYYDPQHEICQGSAPANPQPGYGPWQNNYPGIPGSGTYTGGGWR